MNISFSCNIAGRSGHNFIRLSLHIGDTVLGEGWETLGLTTAALQDVLANLNTLHANPSTTPLRDIRPAQAELYVFTEHNALPYGSSAFDGDCLLLFKSERHRKNPRNHRYTALCQAYGQQAMLLPDFPFADYQRQIRRLTHRLLGIQQPLGGSLTIYPCGSSPQ